MKQLIILMLSFFSVSCTVDIEIISSKKQIILPGIKSGKPFLNYRFEIIVNKTTDIKFDSIIVENKKGKFRVNYFLNKKDSSLYIQNLNEIGTYFLDVSLKENSLIKQGIEQPLKEKVIIYFHQGNLKKHITANTFVEETITRR